jgi:hypothetical protein
VVPSQTATALVGKHRLENDTTNGAPGASTRRASRKSRTGWVTYCTETAHIAPSNSASPNGSRGSWFTSCTTAPVSLGLSAISATLRPSPTTARAWKPSGR